MTVIQQLEQVNGAKWRSFFADVGNTDHDVTQRILDKTSGYDCPKLTGPITHHQSYLMMTTQTLQRECSIKAFGTEPTHQRSNQLSRCR